MASARDEERQSLTRQTVYTADLCGIEETAVRHGFIQKVFGILGAQLLVTTIVGALVMQAGKNLSQSNPSLIMTLMFFSLAASIGTMCTFMCCPDVMRQTPTNYILLTIFTLAESVLVGFISAQYTQESVLIVLAITTIVVLSLMLFACQTTYDFTGFAPYLFCFTMVLCGFGFILMMASMLGATASPAFQAIRLVYSIGGALLFSVYIVFDTQMIVGGKHQQFRFSLDDYCMAAIALYIDIIQLFLYLLQIFGTRDR